VGPIDRQLAESRARIEKPHRPGTQQKGICRSRSETAGREPAAKQLDGATLSSGPVVQLAVDLADKLKVAIAAAESLFNLRPRDLGRPFSELEVSYRPAELRSRIEKVKTELRPQELHDVEWLRSGGADPSY
jgi:two-component system CheB/CheR fusion protein